MIWKKDRPYRIPYNFRLGYEYLVWWNYADKMRVKFIKVTPKGFNLLNLDTNKCIIKHHLYLSKAHTIHRNRECYYISERLKIECIGKCEE
jgi:hypothetical protein